MSQSIFHLMLTPRDPLIARDGRPFGAGLRMMLATPGLFSDGWKPGWLGLPPALARQVSPRWLGAGSVAAGAQ